MIAYVLFGAMAWYFHCEYRALARQPDLTLREKCVLLLYGLVPGCAWVLMTREFAWEAEFFFALHAPSWFLNLSRLLILGYLGFFFVQNLHCDVRLWLGYERMRCRREEKKKRDARNE